MAVFLSEKAVLVHLVAMPEFVCGRTDCMIRPVCRKTGRGDVQPKLSVSLDLRAEIGVWCHSSISRGEAPPV